MNVTLVENSDAATSLAEATAPIDVAPRRLDALLFQPSARFSFPHGLFGFPEHLSFELIPTVRDGVYWLHDPSLTFLVIDPFHFFPGHALDVPDDVLNAIGAESPKDVLVLAIVTLGNDPSTTANLQGPIALNPRVGLARQFVVSDPAAEIRAPFILMEAAS